MKRFTCAELNDAMSKLQIVKACDATATGAVRVSLPFYYPDSSQVDVFISQPDVLNHTTISDMGQTSDMLLNIQIAPWGTVKRRVLVQEICESLKVYFRDGVIMTTVEPERMDMLPDAILRIAQACIRVSDLYMTKRLYTPRVYRDDVEEFLGDKDIQFDASVSAPGIYAKDLEIDFLVHGKSRDSLVQTLSTGNAQMSHYMCLEAFSKWHDMEPSFRSKHALVTVYDSSVDVFRPDDLTRLREFASVLAFPAEADQLAAMLSA